MLASVILSLVLFQKVSRGLHYRDSEPDCLDLDAGRP